MVTNLMTNLVTNWVITRLGDQRQPIYKPTAHLIITHQCIIAASLVQNCCIISQSSAADQRTIRTSSKDMDEQFDKSKSGPRKFCIILVKQPCHSSIFCGIQGGDWFYLSHIKDTTMDHLYICILKEVLRKGSRFSLLLRLFSRLLLLPLFLSISPSSPSLSHLARPGIALSSFHDTLSGVSPPSPPVSSSLLSFRFRDRT